MNCKYLRLLLFYLSLFVLPGSSWLRAQLPGIPEEIQLETITIPGGSESNMADRMMQDSLGFIWFPTMVGLYRYNGTNFRHYPLSENGSPANIESVIVDRAGNYWAGSRYGLYRLDAASGEFERFVFTGNPGVGSPNRITDLAEGPDGRIWMATLGGILAFDPETESFEHFDEIQIDGEPFPLVYSETVLTDQTGNIWFGVGYAWRAGGTEAIGGLLRFVPEQNDFEAFFLDHKEKVGIDAPNVSSLYEDGQGYLWIGTSRRNLYRFDPLERTFRHYNVRWQDLANPQNLPQIISCITEDCYGRLWLAVTYGGFYCFDPHTGATQFYLPDPSKPDDLYANNTWKIMTSRDGAIWLDGGEATPVVYTFEPCLFPDTEKRFASFLPDYQVSVIEQRGDEDLWIGTQHSGLFRFQSDGDVQPVNLGSDANSIKALHQDRKGNLWIGCWPEACGLKRIDQKSGRIESWRHDPANSNSLSNDLIMDIQEDRGGKIWVATWGGGLNRFDPDSEIFTPYLHDPRDSTSLGGNFLSSLHEDSRGLLWIGGGGALIEPLESAVLDRFDPEEEAFEHHFKQMELPAFSRIDAITDITDAQDGGLWISKRGVIVYLDPESGEVRSFSPSDFSRNYNWYWSIHSDDSGGLWSASLDGLAYLNPENQQFITLPWNKLPVGSNWWQPIEGVGADRLLVGGQGGCMRFSGQNILEALSDRLPKVILSGFDNQGEAVRSEYLSPAGKKIWEATRVTLPHDRNTFSLDLSVLYYREKEPIAIEYMLKDYDLGWRTMEVDEAASYFKAPPGHYTFQARVQSAAGLVAEPSLNLDILILAPWWRRWWAWTIYALTFLGLSYFFYRFQLRRKLAVTEARQLKEMDALKNRLYTNITHEFRTPLTVISGLTEEIQGYEQEKTLIQRNSRRLLGLVNQILSLQKLESRQMELRLTSGDIARYLNYLTESFQSLAQRKHLRLVYYADPESIPMAFDEDKMQQLVANLISNAIKFTPEYGKVEVGLSLVNSGKDIQIKVRDTGVGIPADQLEHIFDRFHQAENQHARSGEGTGIGLALVKELVKLMDGEIEVESNPSESLDSSQRKGTTFTVLLPRLEAAESVLPKETSSSKAANSFDPALYFSASTLDASVPVVSDQIIGASGLDKYILLVEDNQDVVYYLKTILQGSYRVGLARNGREGLEKAFEEIPDIIISDVMMPEMDGFAFSAALKKDERTSHIPVILLTAKASREERLEGLKTGADAYLTKPFDKEELFIRIEKLLELRKEMQVRYRKKDARQLPDYQDVFLQKLQQVVEKNLGDEHFSTPQLCRAMAMSRTQLHRKIKALLDVPTARFIQLTRLHRARQLILTTDKTIGEISFETGFKDPSYFTKLYVAEFEEKPSDTRKTLDFRR